MINVDANGTDRPIVRVFASYDMGWSQRGNGHTYDSLNGYCALIGLKTGKILDYCTRNRKCRFCDSELKSGKHVEHDCRLNFHGTAKAMEADGAVELVTNSDVLKNASIEIGVFIGDNDSSCITAIQNVTDHQIVKQSDMNHSTKGIGNILHALHNDKSSDPDSELTNCIIKHIQRCFTYAIKQNVGDNISMKAAIANIPHHLFDSHKHCGQWCNDEKENYSGIRLKNNILFEKLKEIFLQLANTGDKFASAASRQPNESLNNSMCSKAPKRLCYSTSESSDFRFSATVAQKNLGTDYLRRTLDHLKIPWTEKLNKYVAKSTSNLEKKKNRSNQVESKKRRLDLGAQRSQLRYQKEKDEGETYRSNMGLLDFPVANDDSCCIQKLLDDNTSYSTENFAIVFLDLETAGLSPSHDILQIAMKSEKCSFSTFITPLSAESAES